MNIRRVEISDLGELAVLFDQYRMFYQQPSDVEAAKLFISKRMNQEESVIFVAEEDGLLIGFTQLYPIFSSVSMKRTWLLNDLYIVQEERDKGVGTALLDAAKEFAKETRAKWLLLQTAQDNTLAQRVYEKHGWVKEKDFFYRIDL